jgi:DNA-binding MarR family transcriptional regulator
VEVTPRGRRAVRHSPQPPTERLLSALSRLSARDAEKLADGLHALLLRMHVSAEHAPMLFD